MFLVHLDFWNTCSSDVSKAKFYKCVIYKQSIEVGFQIRIIVVSEMNGFRFVALMVVMGGYCSWNGKFITT